MDLKIHFLQLLKYSNELKKENRYLEDENPQGFDLFLKSLLRIENNLHYLDRQEYINLAKDFLNNQITVEDFSYSFNAIYKGVNQKLTQMIRIESIELIDFLEPSRSELGKLLARMSGFCENYSSDPEINVIDEEELKDYAQILLVKLQEK